MKKLCPHPEGKLENHSYPDGGYIKKPPKILDEKVTSLEAGSANLLEMQPESWLLLYLKYILIGF